MEITAGRGSRIIAPNGLQKTGDAKEQGLTCSLLEFEKSLQGQPLSEDDKRPLIAPITHGLREGLVNGLLPPVGGDELVQSARLFLKPKLSRRLQHRCDVGRAHFTQWRGAASEVSGSLPRRRGIAQDHLTTQQNLRHLPMLGIPSVEPCLSRCSEENVEHDTIEFDITAMAVPLPVTDIGIQFDISPERFAIQYDGAI